MRDNDVSLLTAFDKAFRKLLVAVIASYLVIAALGGYVFVESAAERADIAHEVITTRASLCVFVGELQNRVESSEKFIRLHPNGAPGIPIRLLKQNLANLESTIQSLSGLGC